MRFARFGVTLETLGRSHLELVRGWRNSDLVRPNMRYREFIRPEDQVRWFEAIIRENNWYFVAYVRDLPFALFHIRYIDWDRRCGEAGGFVGDPQFIGQPEPAVGTLALMDFAFLMLQLQSLQAHYSPRLPRIAQFNRQLGYETDLAETDGFVCASVNAERYLKRAGTFRKAALRLHGPAAVLMNPPSSLSRRIEQLRALPREDFQIQVLGSGGA
jgi:hypothetical protein